MTRPTHKHAARPSYKRAIEFVALNFAHDQDLESDVTVSLIAELWGHDVVKVATDIAKLRKQER